MSLPLTTNEKLTQAAKRKLCRAAAREYGIAHSQENIRSTSSSLPFDLKERVNKIAEIKGFTFDRYGENESDVGKRKFIARQKQRANHIALSARERAGSNESQWRHSTENDVFKDVENDVVCQTCQKRKWRSEKEIEPSTDSLKRRMKNRRFCKCTPLEEQIVKRPQWSHRNIFTSRVEPRFLYLQPKELNVKLPFVQAPDLLIGLKDSAAIVKSLWSRRPGGWTVAHSLEQPVQNNVKGAELLFPFAILEAKRDEGDDWDDIWAQTVIPLFSMLNLQREVFQRGSASAAAGPTAWFFLTRGPEWRVYLAYQTAAGSFNSSASYKGFVTRTFQVWEGTLTRRNDALQILLIVDYMLDWARDKYREDILANLRSLAGPGIDFVLEGMDESIYSKFCSPDMAHLAVKSQLSGRLSGQRPFPDIFDPSSITASIKSLLTNDHNRTADNDPTFPVSLAPFHPLHPLETSPRQSETVHTETILDAAFGHLGAPPDWVQQMSPSFNLRAAPQPSMNPAYATPFEQFGTSPPSLQMDSASQHRPETAPTGYQTAPTAPFTQFGAPAVSLQGNAPQQPVFMPHGPSLDSVPAISAAIPSQSIPSMGSGTLQLRANYGFGVCPVRTLYERAVVNAGCLQSLYRTNSVGDAVSQTDAMYEILQKLRLISSPRMLMSGTHVWGIENIWTSNPDAQWPSDGQPLYVGFCAIRYFYDLGFNPIPVRKLSLIVIDKTIYDTLTTEFQRIAQEAINGLQHQPNLNALIHLPRLQNLLRSSRFQNEVAPWWISAVQEHADFTGQKISDLALQSSSFVSISTQGLGDPAVTFSEDSTVRWTEAWDMLVSQLGASTFDSERQDMVLIPIESVG